MIVLALLAALQARPATVGDTVWIAIKVALPAGQILRPQTWDLGDLGQALGPPELSYEADSATVRYPVSFWFPGEHRLTVPGPIVVTTTGRSDTLPARVMLVPVASVLPAGQPKTELAPKDAAPVLPQADRSWLPLGVLLPGAGLLIGLLWWRSDRRIRRRRVTAPPPPARPEPEVNGRLREWAALGETRTALDGWAHVIERELGRKADPGLQAETAPLLERMAVAGFDREGSIETVEGLIAEAETWVAEHA